MRTLLQVCLYVLVLFFSPVVMAFTPPTAPTDGFLLDQANVLSAEDSTRIKTQLRGINEQSRNEIAVFILSSLEGESIEDVAYATFNSWGVGKKDQDNGVLLVLAIKDRKSRIETGKGVGGELTDIQSKQILDSLRPHLKEQQYSRAIEVGINSISNTLEKRSAPEKNSGSGGCSVGSEENQPWPWWMYFVIVAAALLYIGIAYAIRDPFWGLGLVLTILTAGKGGGSSSGSSGGFGGGRSGGGGSNSSW